MSKNQKLERSLGESLTCSVKELGKNGSANVHSRLLD